MKYTHYVLDYRGRVVGLVAEVEPCTDEGCGCAKSFGWVYFCGMPQFAEYGYTENRGLVALPQPIESYEKHEEEGGWVQCEIIG